MSQPPTPERTSRIPDLVRSFRLEDLLTARQHSRDFTFYRSDYLLVRVKLFALLFGVATPLWLPVDMWLLPPESLAAMGGLRALTGFLFLLLALVGTRRRSLARARTALVGLIVIPALFYLASRIILGEEAMQGALVGYTFLPFVLLAGGALFPLTFLEGGGILVVVYLSVLAVGWHAGTLFTLPFLGTLWLLVLLSGIALWAQSAQLHMLLGLYRQATRDPLTGLFNRRALFRQGEAELARARRQGAPVSLLLLDIDRFKRINDHWGHRVGDAVLRHLADILQREFRAGDLPGRYGGEEFVVLAMGADYDGATALAERIRLAVADSPAPVPEGSLPYSVSIGVGSGRADEPLEELLQRADEALLQAKEAGRDRVVALAGTSSAPAPGWAADLSPSGGNG
ncbi:GGDEF domain-containing protein [Thiohalorhabdus denitrificans]|uniref:diguanylate cyclase n=1 Tax=Thiohalorhabdus denitrificans TaxID=381306 RepID=A0A1G5G8I5_9GAMM|nr:GGDEF domain-containing protein [Thiohalorhabdus denitrificans]SCY47667.1 diguanylate cyclase (GGDEF) domain-containing protein [Thiohalorhabdus denitrificans]